jgi:membrane protease YdiL (CAAX protease family)
MRAKMFSSIAMHWDFALILLFLGVVIPWMGRRRIRQLMEMPSTTRLERLSLYASTIAFQWVATCVILWRTASRGIQPAELGLAIPRVELAWTVTVLLSLLILANQIVSLRRLAARPQELHGLLPHLALKVFPQDTVERLVFLALVLTVAICEELIYRGFVQYVFQRWAGGTVIVGIIASTIFFGLAHLYQDKRGTTSTVVIGAIFSAVRSWTDSLVPSVIAHFLADLIVGFFAPARVRAALEQRNNHSASTPESQGHINLCT